ncbi:MAG: hypothetical protein QM775_18885 [Pirellulales bacterium]
MSRLLRCVGCAAFVWACCASLEVVRAAVELQAGGFQQEAGFRYDWDAGRQLLTLEHRNASDVVDRWEIRLDGRSPLLSRIATVRGDTVDVHAEELDLAAYMTVGSREIPRGTAPRKPTYVFFDNPHKRAHETFRSKLDLKSAKLTSRNGRAVLTIGELTIGPFRGHWELTFFADSPLVKIEAVVATDEPSRAYVYDLGLIGSRDGLKSVGYVDLDGRPKQIALDEDAPINHCA